MRYPPAVLATAIMIGIVGCSSGDPQAASPDDAATAGLDAEVGIADAGGDALSGPLLDDGVVSVAPIVGSTSGLTKVDIRGGGFLAATQVLFDGSPAAQFEILSAGHITALTPPRPPGTVDVTVRQRHEEAGRPPTFTDLTLPFAFTYHAPITVTGVAPSKGSAAGGEAVTLSGSGFTGNTRFVFGDRLALQPVVIDSLTATVVTPPGVAGRAHVTAANDVGTATLQRAYRYTSAPRIDSVAPAVATTDGGGELRMHGVGLLGQGGSAWLIGADKSALKAGIKASGSDGTWLAFSPPPLPVGLYGVRYLSVDGVAECAKCAVIVAPPAASDTANTILAVAPASAPGNTNAVVSIAVAGQVAQLDKPEVRFDGLKAELLQRYPAAFGGVATLVVRAPAGLPGKLPRTVAVAVGSGAAAVTAADAFTWTAAKARIIDVKPYQLESAGGTPVTISYGPLQDTLGPPLAVRIGALVAAQVKIGKPTSLGDATVTCVAPQGSPGPADVELVFADVTLAKPAAVLFGGGEPSIAALIPARGSQAGGTWVRVVGSALDKFVSGKLGGAEIPTIKVLHPGLAHIWTPAGVPGPASLQARFAGAVEQTIANAFVYFDPLSGNLGTWGPPIENTLNVTVTQRYFSDGGPVPNAWVVVGADEKTPYKGLTDSRGQITFSGPGLHGPLDVHASKAGFTAASVIGFNTENVTLLIRDKQPHSSQGTSTPADPPKQFHPGTIKGHVVDAAKYVQLPAGSCVGHPVVSGHCKPCTASSQCDGATTCEVLGDPLAGFSIGGPSAATVTTGERFCAAACLTADDCPATFECRVVSLAKNANKYRCVPRIGVAETRCEVSRYGFFSPNSDPGTGWIADPATGAFTLGSRLGQVAVFCNGGYVRDSDGEFVPLALGVARSLQVASGTATTGVNIVLDMPLRRTLRLRLERLPVDEKTSKHTRFAEAQLELGGDGWLPIGTARTTLRTDTLELPRQPSTLKGPLQGVSYAFYAGVYNEFDDDEAPAALGWAEQLQPADADSFAWWPAGAAKPESKMTWGAPINAVAQVDELAVGVGDGGAVSVWSGQGWTQQASPTNEDLRAVWLAEDGADGWAGGTLGTLLRRHSITGWAPAISPTNATIVAIAGRAKQDVWVLDRQHALWRHGPVVVPDGGGLDTATPWLKYAGPLGAPVGLEVAAGFELDPIRLRCMWQAPDGTLFVGADAGLLWTGKQSGSSVAWTALPKVTTHRIRSITGTSSDDVWVVGDRGFIAHFDGKALLTVAPLTDQPLFAVRVVDGAVHAVGGQGAWVVVNGAKTSVHDLDLHVDLTGIVATKAGLTAAGHAVVPLGPYLELPYITQPAAGQDLAKDVAWQTLPGADASLNRVRVLTFTRWPQWDIFTRGDLKAVKLPRWPVIGGFSPLPAGPLRVQVYRILAPSISVDLFNYQKLSLYDWTSFSFGWALSQAEPGPLSPFP